MLLLKVNPKIVETLVAHALAGPTALAAERRPAEAAPAEGTAAGPEAEEAGEENTADAEVLDEA